MTKNKISRAAKSPTTLAKGNGVKPKIRGRGSLTKKQAIEQAGVGVTVQWVKCPFPGCSSDFTVFGDTADGKPAAWNNLPVTGYGRAKQGNRWGGRKRALRFHARSKHQGDCTTQELSDIYDMMTTVLAADALKRSTPNVGSSEENREDVTDRERDEDGTDRESDQGGGRSGEGGENQEKEKDHEEEGRPSSSTDTGTGNDAETSEELPALRHDKGEDSMDVTSTPPSSVKGDPSGSSSSNSNSCGEKRERESVSPSWGGSTRRGPNWVKTSRIESSGAESKSSPVGKEASWQVRKPSTSDRVSRGAQQTRRSTDDNFDVNLHQEDAGRVEYLAENGTVEKGAGAGLEVKTFLGADARRAKWLDAVDENDKRFHEVQERVRQGMAKIEEFHRARSLELFRWSVDEQRGKHAKSGCEGPPSMSTMPELGYSVGGSSTPSSAAASPAAEAIDIIESLSHARVREKKYLQAVEEIDAHMQNRKAELRREEERAQELHHARSLELFVWDVEERTGKHDALGSEGPPQ